MSIDYVLELFLKTDINTPCWLSHAFWHRPKICTLSRLHTPRSDLIARVFHLLGPHKLLFDAPRAHEPHQQVHAPRLVVRAARSRAPERLLPHHRPGALAVDVEIARRVPQRVLRVPDGFPVGREDGAREGVGRGAVDELAHVLEGGQGGVVVDV